MARLIVPTMPMRVNPNPRGSATKHVTMSGDNPFERETLAVRGANSPMVVTNAMLPGMGLGETPGGTSGGFKVDWGKAFTSLTEGVIDVGTSLAQREIDRKINRIPTQQAAPAQTPVIVQVPTAHPSSGGLPQMLPWIIGGVAILAVGGIMLAAKGGGGRRSSRH